MKCQILFSRKNKKNITSLSSVESAHSIVSVRIVVKHHTTYITSLRGWAHLADVPPFLRETTLYINDFLFVFLYTKPLLKMVLL